MSWSRGSGVAGAYGEGEDRSRRFFGAWQAAERRGQDDRALELLTELVAERQRRWLRSATGRPDELDLDLLDALGSRLQIAGRHAEALEVYGAARGLAVERGDRYAEISWGLRGAQSCVALLDLDAAATALGSFLGLAAAELGDSARVAWAIARLSPPLAGAYDRQLLRIDAGLAIARYQGARGLLGAAAATLGGVLDLLAEHESPTVSIPDVGVRLAEILLDRGDLGAAEIAIDQIDQDRAPAELRIQGGILRAQLRHLEGRFSEANRLLRPVAQHPLPRRLEPLRAAARWQRAHVLASLNRLDEAEAEVRALDDEGGCDLPALRALLAGRRGGAEAALSLPPSSRQMLAFSEALDTPPVVPGEEDLGAATRSLRRTRERVRDEYGRLFNGVLLALHHGHLRTALAVTTVLADWVTELDSPLLAARQEHLWALAFYCSGDLRAAERAASRALEAYRGLGMAGEQWAMSRVLGWALEIRNAPATERDAVLRRSAELQRTIATGLDAEDRALYALNKWTTIDEEVSIACRRGHAVLAATGPAGEGRLDRAVRGWQRRRASRLLLREVLRLRGAHSEKPESAGAAAEGESAATAGGDRASEGGRQPPKDVFRLAQEGVRRRLGRGDDPALTRRLAPGWLPADTALLHYVVLPDRIELFLLTRRGCELVPIASATSRPDLWERVRRVLDRLIHAWLWEADSELCDLAERLGLDEIADRLPARVRHLAVIPDDILAHVPFAALPVAGLPLARRWTLAVLPALRWCSGSPQRGLRGARGLGVGVTRSNADSSYRRIPAAAREVRRLAQRSSGSWLTLVDASASRAAVLAALGEAEVAHFACHGDFFAERPDSSGLLLDDGWLTVEDAFRIALGRLRMAVLASCWGASTSVLPGGIHVGFPFALVDSGAKAVLASLWEVPDEANLRFTVALHRAAAKVGPIGALAVAQRRSITAEAPPAHWAGWVAYTRSLAPSRPVRWLLRLVTARRQERSRGRKPDGAN